MALFQRQDKNHHLSALYTVGQQKNLMIVGLGNVGKKYVNTRHNIGFACIDHFVHKNDFPNWQEKKDMGAYVSSSTINGVRIIAVKPSLFMNNSGKAVQAIGSFYKIPPSDTVVVHDELDIPFGQIRTRIGGSAAGNNGVKSIIQHGYEDCGRIRIGIKAETRMDSTAFVLARFSDTEQKHLKPLVNECEAILTECIYSGRLPHDTRSIL